MRPGLTRDLFRGAHRGNHHRRDSSTRLYPVADEIEILERPLDPGPSLSKLIGSHFPSQHGAMMVQRVSERRLRRGAEPDHSFAAKSGKELLQAPQNAFLDFLLVCGPVK